MVYREMECEDRGRRECDLLEIFFDLGALRSGNE